MIDANVIDAVVEAENLGVRLKLTAGAVTVTLPAGDVERLAGVVEELREKRDQIAEFLLRRNSIPVTPQGVHVLCWNLKVPPVTIDSCSVVVDCDLFARRTLEQLRLALAQPKRWMGWSLPQLTDRLRQVGVDLEVVELQETSQLGRP